MFHLPTREYSAHWPSVDKLNILYALQNKKYPYMVLVFQLDIQPYSDLCSFSLIKHST
jgi:hypothetical protein